MYKFLIKSRGRTGCHIICEYFHCYGLPIFYKNSSGEFLKDIDETFNDLVIRSHDSSFIPDDPENYILILSSRKNKFDQYCSHKIAQRTKNYNGMPPFDPTLNTISINIEDAKNNIREYREWDQKIREQANIFKWKKFIEVSYEDIKDSFNILFKLFPLEKKYQPTNNFDRKKSPYNFENYIYKYNKLNEKFKGFRP